MPAAIISDLPLHKQPNESWTWWFIPLVLPLKGPTTEGLRKEDFHKVKANLELELRSCLRQTKQPLQGLSHCSVEQGEPGDLGEKGAAGFPGPQGLQVGQSSLLICSLEPFTSVVYQLFFSVL